MLKNIKERIRNVKVAQNINIKPHKKKQTKQRNQRDVKAKRPGE